jgi:hypothetical protein
MCFQTAGLYTPVRQIGFPYYYVFICCQILFRDYSFTCDAFLTQIQQGKIPTVSFFIFFYT